MPLQKADKEQIIHQYQIHQTDTGSPEVQIALLTRRINQLVEHLKAQAAPDYEPGITDLAEQEEEAAETGERDEKFDLAVELVAETRNASISMLQRRLRIGYNRAARIIETMEKEGMIGPSDGLKPREVYIPRR